MNKQQAKQLKVAIQELVDAEVADSWKGGGDPADIPIIEAELKACRIVVSALIAAQVEK